MPLITVLAASQAQSVGLACTINTAGSKQGGRNSEVTLLPSAVLQWWEGSGEDQEKWAGCGHRSAPSEISSVMAVFKEENGFHRLVGDLAKRTKKVTLLKIII